MRKINFKLWAGVALAVVAVAVIIIVVNVVPRKVIDVEFYDGYIPGNTYKISLDESTKELEMVATPGCSLPDENECPEQTEYNMTLDDEEYDLAVRGYKIVKDEINAETGKNADLLNWVYALIAFNVDDGIYMDKSEDWDEEEWVQYGYAAEDTDGDGKVTGREHGTYIIKSLIALDETK